MGRTGMKKIILELDDLDHEAISGYIASYQAESRKAFPGQPTMLPDGDSNLAGAIMAECVRNLLEYRAIWRAEHPE